MEPKGGRAKLLSDRAQWWTLEEDVILFVVHKSVAHLPYEFVTNMSHIE
jgi:hypothetical protein